MHAGFMLPCPCFVSSNLQYSALVVYSEASPAESIGARVVVKITKIMYGKFWEPNMHYINDKCL